MNTYKEKESPNIINKMRVKVNPEYNVILENWPLSSDVKKILDNSFESNGVTSTIIDLEGRVLYEFDSQFKLGSKIDITEHLYFDNSYEIRNNKKYLLSLPIYNQGTVVGFTIFETIIESIRDENYMPFQWLFTIILLSILWIISIIVTIIGYKKELSNGFSQLIDGLNHVSKGIFKPLKVPKESKEQDIYISYNRMVEELSYLMKKQQSYEGKRKSFLTTISHELKTPIATINAYIEGLVSGVAKDEKTINNYHTIIQSKMNSLMNQVNDLFKYAQYDMNQFKYNFQEVYADDVFHNILKPIFNKDRKREIIISNNIPKCMINVDIIRIEQVILNFYNNAIKHTSDDGTIKIEGYRQENELLISVEDNGEGIESRDLPYIFDYYYQGKTSKESDYEGVGLGLAICKEIISKHGGKIFVKSQLNKGTKISFTIPVV
ncbi:HAMP domain-containing histidine kinase [Clostridium sp. D2Q-11]|uniref:histidine kinase n=1 Tax=Anaeromonas frigoriresistens TaxID=2683708 RepID=A0A942UQJ7_9FIRM|nr:HAMP domain-containing sensor histidine kinase [Anaeromonas frigoriresistens]MBS4537363.1 HAMP domain-containing histidine kinase [Anaeromonas frigoriresistens]